MDTRLQELYTRTLQEIDVKEQLDSATRIYGESVYKLREFQKILKKEKHDVDKLQHISIAKLISSLQGTIEERLEKEIKEYEDAQKAFSELQRNLDNAKQKMIEFQVQYSEIMEAKKEFDERYQQQLNRIHRDYPEVSKQLEDLNRQVKELKLLIIEERQEQARQEDQIRTGVIHRSLPIRSSQNLPQTTISRGRSALQSWSNQVGKQVSEQKDQQQTAYSDFEKYSNNVHRDSDKTDSTYYQLQQLEQQIFDLIVYGDYSE